MTYEEYCKQRDHYGLTDYAVSNLSEVSRATLSQWKNGRSKPSKSTINKIKRVFSNCENTAVNRPFGSGGMLEYTSKLAGKQIIPAKSELDMHPEVMKMIIRLNDGTAYLISMDEYDQLQNSVNAFTHAWLKEKKIMAIDPEDPDFIKGFDFTF